MAALDSIIEETEYLSSCRRSVHEKHSSSKSAVHKNPKFHAAQRAIQFRYESNATTAAAASTISNDQSILHTDSVNEKSRCTFDNISIKN